MRKLVGWEIRRGAGAMRRTTKRERGGMYCKAARGARGEIRVGEKRMEDGRIQATKLFPVGCRKPPCAVYFPRQD